MQVFQRQCCGREVQGRPSQTESTGRPSQTESIGRQSQTESIGRPSHIDCGEKESYVALASSREALQEMLSKHTDAVHTPTDADDSREADSHDESDDHVLSRNSRGNCGFVMSRKGDVDGDGLGALMKFDECYNSEGARVCDVVLQQNVDRDQANLNVVLEWLEREMKDRLASIAEKLESVSRHIHMFHGRRTRRNSGLWNRASKMADSHKNVFKERANTKQGDDSSSQRPRPTFDRDRDRRSSADSDHHCLKTVSDESQTVVCLDELWAGSDESMDMHDFTHIIEDAASTRQEVPKSFGSGSRKDYESSRHSLRTTTSDSKRKSDQTIVTILRHSTETEIPKHTRRSVWPSRMSVLGWFRGDQRKSDNEIKVEARMRKIRETIKSHQTTRSARMAIVWRFLENPYSSSSAYFYSIFIACFVLVSVAVSFWQTVDGSPLQGAEGEAIQTVIEAVFAVELLLRFVCCPDRRVFCANLFNYVDLASALPIVLRIIYAFLSIGSDDYNAEVVLSKMAVIPVLRLLKLTRRFEQFQLLFSAFLIALEALPVLLYTLIVIALIFSALVYLAEPENMKSQPRALWFIIVTMTTVGYGDITPESVMGHFVATILMIISGLYMAIPIGIVGNAFSQVWSDRDRLLLMQRVRDAFLQEGFSPKAMQDILKVFDEDDDGHLDLEEFKMMLQAMHIHIGAEREFMLLEALDQNGDGTVNVLELMDGLFPRQFLSAVSYEVGEKISGAFGVAGSALSEKVSRTFTRNNDD